MNLCWPGFRPKKSAAGSSHEAMNLCLPFLSSPFFSEPGHSLRAALEQLIRFETSIDFGKNQGLFSGVIDGESMAICAFGAFEKK